MEDIQYYNTVASYIAMIITVIYCISRWIYLLYIYNYVYIVFILDTPFFFKRY